MDIPIGIDVVVSDFLCTETSIVQFRFPKSKKKRIRRKWAKQKKNCRITTHHKAYKMGNTLYVSSFIKEHIKQFSEQLKSIV